jgi:hypothetical protein
MGDFLGCEASDVSWFGLVVLELAVEYLPGHGVIDVHFSTASTEV